MARNDGGHAGWSRGVVAALWLLSSLSTTEILAAEPGQGKAGRVQAAAPASSAPVQLPRFPQKFDVQGPESDSFGFAVTQPGPIAVDVQAQGAPVIVTLQSPGGPPIIQQGTGLLRLFYTVTPQDVQRSLFWHVQVKAWCEEDCLTAGKRPRSTGSVAVQHPPMDQAAVQKAVQAAAAKQKQAADPDPAQAAALAAQMDQAFQQRKTQFEQLQQQRRAALFAQIQPQVEQLRARVGLKTGIRARGVEGSPEAEQAVEEGEIGTRALPQMRGQTARAMGMPTFPQPFTVQGPESDAFGFAVTQPGPIQVEVQSQGPPVIVTLQHLASAPTSQQGSGQIRLGHEATPQDVQKSALWVVKIRLAQAGPPASGTVMVQHPPADQAIVQAQTAALAAQERSHQARTEPEAEAQSRAEFQEFKARLEQQYQQRLATERAQNQALLKRLRPQAGGMIRSRGLNPTITKVNRSEGEPKTQIIIEGSNFGPGGEVVFQLGPNMTGTGIVEAWGDTVVVANVPDASGLLPYQGTVAIKVGQTLSNTVPFKFVPVEEVREIRSAQGQDVSLANPALMTGSMIEHPNNSFAQLSGSKGNDIFFPTRQLSNGWVVQDIKLKIDPCAYPNCRGGYVADSRLRTASPFFNVRWWHEALVGARYWFSLWIIGPRGVPDGIAVTGPLVPVVPPGTPPPATTASSTPEGRTPPAQPPYTPPASSAPAEPPQMTMGMIAPGVLYSQVQIPGTGSATPPATASANQPPNVTTTSPPSGMTTQPPGTPPAQPASTNPVITSLSVTQGQPGDPVMINGSNFGPGLGEIHFVIANGKDLKAPAGAIWSDNQIFTSVPDASGLLAFNGQVYVKRAGDQTRSNLVAFRFEPSLELRQSPMTDDVRVASPGSKFELAGRWWVWRRSDSPFWGHKGNDYFFNNTRLRNGWVLENASVAIYSQQCGNAYVQETRVNTDWPYLDVRWWIEGCNTGDILGGDVGYGVLVTIKGPKGVPDGLVVR